MIRFLLVFCLALSTATNSFAQWFKREEPIMGTRVYVELWWQNEARANELMQQVMDEMERINQLMSPYKTRSELSAINRLASEQAVPVSAELFRLIQTSVRYSDVSDGASLLPRSAASMIIGIRSNQRNPNAKRRRR